jgi:membrane-associated phospholipid phosphatase
VIVRESSQTLSGRPSPEALFAFRHQPSRQANKIIGSSGLSFGIAALALGALLVALCPMARAQAPALPSTTPRAGSTCDLVSSTLTCFGDVFRDQAGIWTAPTRLRGRKLLWLVPFGVATTLALEYDARAMNALGPSPTRIRVSNDYTYLGSGYTLVSAAGLTYLLGKIGHRERYRETGMLSLEALADAGLVAEGIKLATNRQRPYAGDGTGKFWPDDTDIYTTSGSFPSGHSTASFAVARVIVEETPGHPWLHVALYGLATGVAIARVTGDNHFPSDALVGTVIGYEIGGYVYHRRSAFYVPKAKSLQFEPLYNPLAGSFGVSFSLAARP